MYSIRRTYRFCASHAVRDPSWSEERNREVFGPPSHPSGHGHNFRLTIVIEGEPDPETRRVVDLRELDRRIEDAVLLPYDHRNLNRDVSTLQGKVPTLEVLLEDVWDRVAAVLPSGELREVVLRIDEFLSGSLRR